MANSPDKDASRFVTIWTKNNSEAYSSDPIRWGCSRSIVLNANDDIYTAHRCTNKTTKQHITKRVHIQGKTGNGEYLQKERIKTTTKVT
jgi:hypothetical protein